MAVLVRLLVGFGVALILFGYSLARLFILVGSGFYESLLFYHLWGIYEAVCESSLFFYDPTLNVDKKQRFTAPLLVGVL